MTTLAIREARGKRESLNNLDHSGVTTKAHAFMALICEISKRQGRQMGGGAGAAGLRVPFPGSLEIQRLSCRCHPAARKHLFPEGPALCQQQVAACPLGGREAAGGSSDVCLRQDAASLPAARQGQQLGQGCKSPFCNH